MRPDSYKDCTRRCGNCTFAVMLAQTSFMRTMGRETWCCEKTTQPPKLPEGASMVKYVGGYLTDRAVKEGKLAPLPPPMDPAEAAEVRKKYKADYAQWVEANKVSPDGSCDEHMFRVEV